MGGLVGKAEVINLTKIKVNNSYQVIFAVNYLFQYKMYVGQLFFIYTLV